MKPASLFLRFACVLAGAATIALQLPASAADAAQTPAPSARKAKREQSYVPVAVAPVTTTPPVLQHPTGDGVTVFWSVGGPSTGWIEYGETEALGRKAQPQRDGLFPFDSKVLRIRIDGLKPGRLYHYRTVTVPVFFKTATSIHRGAPVASKVHTFRTLDPAAKTVRFAVFSDTHTKVPALNQVLDRLEKAAPELLFWNGDLFNNIASEEMAVSEVLHPAGRAFATDRPVYIVRGNHETRGVYARDMRRVVETPGNNYYYQFRQGPIAFVVLYTGEDKVDDHIEYGGLNDFESYRAEQVQWLRRALQSPEFQNAPFRVLITHIPLRNPRGVLTPAERAFSETVLKAGFDLGVSGHLHNHYWMPAEPQAPMPWLIVGGWNEKGTLALFEANESSLAVKAILLDGKPVGEWLLERKRR